MEFFWVKHPNVDQPAQVPATALGYWEGRGWEQFVPASVPNPTVDLIADPPDAATASETTTRAPRRRPATEE